jgi:hypothetical protein
MSASAARRRAAKTWQRENSAHRPAEQLARGLGPVRNRTGQRPGRLIERQLARQSLPALAAQVVGAPLQQGHGGGPSEQAPEQRQVAMEELVLQRAGAGGNDHAPPREQRGNQVRKGLSGAGSGLGHEPAAVLKRAGHGTRHRQL